MPTTTVDSGSKHKALATDHRLGAYRCSTVERQLWDVLRALGAERSAAARMGRHALRCRFGADFSWSIIVG